MLVRRSALALLRQTRSRQPIAARAFSISTIRHDAGHKAASPKVPSDPSKLKSLSQVNQDDDVLPPGAPVGSVPTDLNQSTGLERMEILGKMEGIDIFDMRPLDGSRKGTLENPIIVKSFGEEQYVGCNGVPRDSHRQIWLTISRDRPTERCTECGNVVKMEYTGPEDPHHGHHTFHYDHDSLGFVDHLKPEYKNF